MTDIEIANSVKLLPITKIAKKLKINKKSLILYGNYIAKIQPVNKSKKGKLILVSAINPTSAGEGKTTVSIGLADALCKLKKKTCLALREPSLGPVFGIKGGATGGGKSQVVPMEDINLHFTGDFHAITSANNLLAAMIDNHIFQGNELKIEKVLFERCLDINDRALRKINLTDRNESFNITSASETMAVLCMAKDIIDLKRRLGNILIGLTSANKPIYARDLKAENAMAILLKDALKPNLVQTLEGTPAIIHLGPFANIAHGCNSVNATTTALSLADYVVTEAGFGADLGAEKFLDFKCREMNISPDAVVIVATVKALKLHGNGILDDGICNLEKHIENIKNVFGLPCVVALNKFSDDTEEEIKKIKSSINELSCKFAISTAYKDGGKGAISLAETVINLCEEKSSLKYCYSLSDSVENKILKIATKIYGASNIEFTEQAIEDLKLIKKLKLQNLPIIIAKTQYSLSDNMKLIGRPKGFNIKIDRIKIRSGAGFLCAVAGSMLLMPGLSKTPAALNMEINNNLKISGLF